MGILSNSNLIIFQYRLYLIISKDGRNVWDKVFESGQSKICRRQPLKNLNRYGLLKQIISLQFFWRLSSTNITWSTLEYSVPFINLVALLQKIIGYRFSGRFYSFFGDSRLKSLALIESSVAWNRCKYLKRYGRRINSSILQAIFLSELLFHEFITFLWNS